MNPMISDLGHLEELHYVGRLERGSVCTFRIEAEKFEMMRQVQGGNFCIILHGPAEEVDDYFVIPLQVLTHVLARASPKRLAGDASNLGWDGTIINDTTLSIEGCHFEVEIGSCHKNERLLRWLIDGNDLYSFPQYRADEAADDWPAYEPPRPKQAGMLKELLDDIRKILIRQYVSRPGQAEFRDALRQRYGDGCMVTGCPLMGVVEAAHIIPYRIKADHHPANGLLLRADIHALFDLHLLGIEPELLTVSVHPEARRAGYDTVIGLKLQIATELRPSRDALEKRWCLFQERLQKFT